MRVTGVWIKLHWFVAPSPPSGSASAREHTHTYLSIALALRYPSSSAIEYLQQLHHYSTFQRTQPLVNNPPRHNSVVLQCGGHSRLVKLQGF